MIFFLPNETLCYLPFVCTCMVWVFFLKSPRLDINQSNCVAQDYVAQDKLPSSQACFLTGKMIGLDLMIFRVGHTFSCPVFVLSTTRHLSKQLRVRPISSNLSVFLEIYYSFGFHVSSLSVLLLPPPNIVSACPSWDPLCLPWEFVIVSLS